jgi:predicted Zn-dependent protease
MLHQQTGIPVTWAERPVTIQSALGEPYDRCVASAIAEWAAIVPILILTATSPNTIRWATPEEVPLMGHAAMSTHMNYRLREGEKTHTIVDASIRVNPQIRWSLYHGPLVRGANATGEQQTAWEFRRSMLHELGHVLGLDHPQVIRQDAPSIMEPYISATDQCTMDDRRGLRALYPEESVTGGEVPSGSLLGACLAWCGLRLWSWRRSLD